MTKLVRKLKQMAKKRAHRKAVQKRKIEREQREYEREQANASQALEQEVDDEITRLENEEIDRKYNTDKSKTCLDDKVSNTNKKINPLSTSVRIAGDLVLNVQPRKQNKKQLSRKQMRRREKLQVRGEAVNDSLVKKWDHKKRRVKVRAQIRNEDLHNE